MRIVCWSIWLLAWERNMTNIRKILIISINFLLYIVVLDPHHILRYILFSFKQVYENSQSEELQVTTMVKARFCIFFFFFLFSGFHFLLCLVQILGIIHATMYVPWNTGSFTMIPAKMIISISNRVINWKRLDIPGQWP